MTDKLTAKKHIPLYGTQLIAQIRSGVKLGEYPKGRSIVNLRDFVRSHDLNEAEAEELINFLDGHQSEAPTFRLDAGYDHPSMLVTVT